MKTPIKLNIPEYIKVNLDKYKYVLVVCALGLLLAFWPFGPGDNGPTVAPAAEGEPNYDADALALALEEYFGQIDGVGRVKVILTVKSGFESVYAYDETSSGSDSETGSSNSLQQQLVTVSGGGEESPVVRKVNYPQYMGAVVICDGGGSSRVKLELTQAIRSLTGITADNIVITKMKN